MRLHIKATHAPACPPTGLSSGGLAAAVVVPVIAAAVLLAAGLLLLARRQRSRHLTLLGKARAPTGPSTSLVITVGDAALLVGADGACAAQFFPGTLPPVYP